MSFARKPELPEPPYTITDVPRDKNIYVKICKLTGRQWPNSSFEKHFDNYIGKGKTAIRLYIDKDDFRLAWDNMDSNNRKSNKEIHYKDPLQRFSEII
jgi:hypothetical protein